MTPLFQPVKDLARAGIAAARAALRRGALVGTALLIALLGAAFLVVAAFLGLRALFGPGLAAMILGLALLAIAASVLLWTRNAVRSDLPSVSALPRRTLPTASPPGPADAATMAVFTVAFLLGRRLADGRGRSGTL